MLIGNLKDFDPASPQPGMYLDMPEKVYRDARAWNWSVLSMGAGKNGTMSKVKYAVDHPDEEKDTDDKRDGRIFDIVHLQPDKIENYVTLVPLTYSKETTSGRGDKKKIKVEEKKWSGNATYCKQWKAEAISNGLEVMRDKDLARLMTMAESLNTVQGVLEFITGAIIQPCIFWKDGVPDRQKGTTGSMCKAKLDIYKDVGETITIADDKKVAKSAAYEAFCGHVLAYKMYGQFAMYMDGVNALLKLSGDKRRCRLFRVLVVEDHAPYDAAAYNIHDREGNDSREWLQAGRLLWHGALENVAHCLKIGKWGGYNCDNLDRITEPESLIPPEWATARLELL